MNGGIFYSLKETQVVIGQEASQVQENKIEIIRNHNMLRLTNVAVIRCHLEVSMASIQTVSLIAFALVGSSVAWADDTIPVAGKQDLPLYLTVSGGWNYADSDRSPTFDGKIFFKDGWIGSAGLGTNFSDHWRGELEVAVRRNGLDRVEATGFQVDVDGHTAIYTGMAKVAYDFGDGQFKPYIGAGIGLADFVVHTTSPSGTDSEVTVAGSLQAGVNYSISPSTVVFFDTQVLLLGDVNVDPSNTGTTKIENPLFLTASIGVRFGF